MAVDIGCSFPNFWRWVDWTEDLEHSITRNDLLVDITRPLVGDPLLPAKDAATPRCSNE